MSFCVYMDARGLKHLGCVDPIEPRCVRCSCTSAIPSPFHNRADVDRRNTVNIEDNCYPICPITKEKVKKEENKT